MSDRFRAVSKLALDDPPERGARASDTWSCARCARRNSPAMRACETCGLDRVPAPGTRRRANMAWSVPAPATGGGAPGDPSGWTGPSPRDPSSWRGPPNVSRAAFDRAAAAKYAAPAPPRGGSRSRGGSSAGRPPKYDAPSTAGDRASSPTASPTEPAWRVADDPVLTETDGDGGDAHANQGVPREDAMMDEDGDEAGDFLYADDAPRAPEPGPPVVVDLTAPDAETLTLDTDALDGTPHDVRACVTCGLDLEEQPDVPLPPDPDDERPEDVVGRWLGRCERGCATALCGPCLTARATTVLQRATRRLEVIISGLGTGYTMMDEDDAPDAPDARSPTIPCPCAVEGGDGGRRRGARECGAALRGAPLTEAEDETHKSWASAATEALFAAAAARAFARQDPGAGLEPAGTSSEAAPEPERGDSPANAPAPAPAPAPGDDMDSDSEPATVPVPTDARLARCPNRDCGAPVELLPPSALPPEPGGLVAERDPNTGRWLSREALEHRHTRRYRCGVCASDFCGDCMVTPYHVGYHLCAAAAAAAAEPRCRYCDRSFLDLGQHYFRHSGARRGGVSGEMSVREMRREMGDVDTTWCTEKEDLRSVYRLTSSVCLAAGCRVKLESACTRTLACGHPCGGIRGETECLPCLRCVPEPPPTDESTNAALAGLAGFAGAANAAKTPRRKRTPRRLPRHDEDCCVCATEPLSAEPALLLGCGHVVHRRCAMERIRAGWPTQNITFAHLQCPLCGESGRPEGERGSAQAAVMLHPALAETLAPALSLREKIMRRARRRLVLDASGPPYQLKPGGEYEGRPGEFALTRYNYYLCEQCEEPYFGGDRACHRGGVERGEGEGQAGAEHKFMCGSCSVTVAGKACKRGHGDDEMEYKCRYCCDVAVWFCFGTTHFCDKCHTAWIRDQPDWEDFPPKKTCTRKTCPLRVDHPDHGKEFCLGCAVCRSAKSFYDKE